MQHAISNGQDLQSMLALAIVAVTALLFARCAVRKARAGKGGCGDGCSCPVAKSREALVRK